MKIHFCVVLFFILLSIKSFSQCCGGGSGSPIAGGASQGVLLEKQFEINSNFQYVNTTKFLSGNKPDTNFADSYNSKYVYTRLAYGLLPKLTISVEAGYWLNKAQVGLHKIDTNSTSGFGDLIIFPRYDVFKISKNSKLTELTLGLGIKIPLGTYMDSTKHLLVMDPFPNEIYYTRNVLAAQPSSGAQDIIFYMFFYRGYSVKKLSFFANAIYIKKGWNPIGEKIGDYASVGLFANKTFFKKIGVTFQLKGEWVDKMKVYVNAVPVGNPNFTGMRKLFFVPQISYNIKGKLTFFLMSEIPLYQDMFRTQIASQYQMTFGVSYRFYIVDPTKKEIESK